MYPNGHIVNYGYSRTAAGSLSRINLIAIGATDVVEYDYLGLSPLVIQACVAPSTDVRYTLAIGSNPYAGLDRFGRIVDLQVAAKHSVARKTVSLL